MIYMYIHITNSSLTRYICWLHLFLWKYLLYKVTYSFSNVHEREYFESRYIYTQNKLQYIIHLC